MLNDTLITRLDTFDKAPYYRREPLLCKDFHFHDIRVSCQSNQPAIMAIMSSMLGMFPEPAITRDHTTYTVLCHDQVSDFAIPLPHQRRRLDTVQLLTGTRLKYYSDLERTSEFQSYVPLDGVNEGALSIIDTTQKRALTQILAPERYQAGFLRRYIFLLALGRLMQQYGFQPCHAAAISAPGNPQQGALILGDSGSGKTTLGLGCAIAGCGLLGDDLVMLAEDTTGRGVEAYSISREVSIRSSSLALWPTLSFLEELPADRRDKRYCSIEQIRSGATQLQTSIRLLLFPSLTTATENVVTRLSKAALLQEMVDQCISKRNMPTQTQEQVFSLLTKLVERAQGYRITIARGSNAGPEIVRSLFAEAAL